MRQDSFYSVRLLERMGIEHATGIAQASFTHYITLEPIL